MTDAELKALVPRVLREAAALVRKGWCQHSYQDISGPTERFCQAGARIHAAAWIAPGHISRLHDLTGDALRSTLNRPDLAGWNDAPERTQQEVAQALEAAAQKA